MKFSKSLNYIEVPPDDHFNYLAEIDWFAHCGEPGGVDKDTAADMILSHEWELFMFARNGDLTKPLFVHHREAFGEWNIISRGVNEFLDRQIFPRLFKAIQKHGIKEDIYAKIRWWMLAYMQEEIYSQFDIPRFYKQMVESYQAGKLPCGWDGDYPEGRFIEH